MNKVSLTQSYQMHHKTRCLDQFRHFFKNFFFFILTVSVHDFVNDNTLVSFESTLEKLVPILESECEVAID